MSHQKIESIIGLTVESVNCSRSAFTWSFDLHLSYGTTLTLSSGGAGELWIYTRLDGQSSPLGAAGKEISFVDYDEELCSSIMHITFTDGTELEVRSGGNEIHWIEAEIK
jgi:hypothetical protein